jgi:hypothetical protein
MNDNNPRFVDAKGNPRIVDGMIMYGEYEGLYVLPLATCMRDSSWDFPSFVCSIALDHLFDDEPTMYPKPEDARKIANAIDLETDADRDAFVEHFPYEWDT